jgi:hypothetical protein
MINKTSIKIAYPIRVGFLSINTTKRIDFSFDNLALHLFRERHKIETGEQLAEWQKKHGEYDAMIFALYSAAESHAMQQRKDFKLDVKKFAFGFAQAKKDDIEQVLKVWKDSQTFGTTTMPGKKKVTAKV